MPFVTVRMTPKTPEQTKLMAERITDAIAETCELRKEAIHVIFETVPREAWSVAGKLLQDPVEKKEDS